MEVSSPELPGALLKWVNTFESGRSVRSLGDLKDGHTLWQILSDIDDSYFKGPLPEPSAAESDNWIPRWQNLKHIERAVSMYIIEECEKLPDVGKNLVSDTKAVAINGAAQPTTQIVTAVLLAAMYSPRSNERMVMVMQELGAKVALPIAHAIEAVEAQDQRLAEYHADLDAKAKQQSVSSPTPGNMLRRTSFERDHELEQEEKLIEAYGTINQLRQQNEDLVTELGKTREQIASLQEELTEHRLQLERGGKGSETEVVTKLRAQSEKDRDYINGLEADLESSRAELETQRRQLDNYNAEGAGRQKLRDDLQEVTAERDELLQQKKASDNLRKKIQTLQEQEKANESLREELQAAQDQLQELESLKHRCSALQKANEENSKTIANSEQEIFDQKRARRQLEHDLRLSLQKIDTGKERQTKDHERIVELEEKLRDFETGQGDTSNVSIDNLDDQITAMEKPKESPAARTAPVATTKDHQEEAEVFVLKQKLEASQARTTLLEEQYLDVYQEKLGLESALGDLRESKEGEESHPFLEQRKKLQSQAEELSALQIEHMDNVAELASVKQFLMAAEANNENGKRSLDADSEYSKLVNAHRALQTRTKQLDVDLDEQRRLLRHALSARTGLQLDDDVALQGSDEYKLIYAQLQAIQAAPVESELLRETAVGLAEKLQEARKQTAPAPPSATPEVDTSRITELERKLNAAEEALSKQQKDEGPEMANLKREMALMTSAWFDLSSRLQVSSVVVQRKMEQPRSWLGKQRLAVNRSPQMLRR